MSLESVIEMITAEVVYRVEAFSSVNDYTELMHPAFAAEIQNFSF